MNKKLIAALFAGAFAFASVSALADDKTPPVPVDQAKLKAEHDAAKSKFDAMTPEQKAATRKAMRDKKVSELTQLEMVAQEGDNSAAADAALTGDAAMKAKSERAAAKAKWDSMSPEQKAATRKAAQSKKLSDLSMLEKMSVGQ